MAFRGVYVRWFTCSWSPAFKTEGFMAPRKTVDAAITSSTHDPLLSLAALVYHWVWCVFRCTTFLIRLRKETTLSFQERGISLWTHQQFSLDWFVNVKVTLLSPVSELPVYKDNHDNGHREQKKTGMKKRGKKQVLLTEFETDFIATSEECLWEQRSVLDLQGLTIIP